MSIDTVENIMGRIRAATEDSPIAVFTAKESGVLNALFAKTLMTSRLIAVGDPTLIGVYHGQMNANFKALQEKLESLVVPLEEEAVAC